MVAFVGSINAGDAGIRVSGNINLAAVQIINAANIQVGGTATGVPTVQPPPVAALTNATNQAGATQQAAAPPAPTTDKDKPSIIIVEFLGFAGGESTPDQDSPNGKSRSNKQGQQSGDPVPTYNPSGPVRILGVGSLSDEQKKTLSEAERGKL